MTKQEQATSLEETFEKMRTTLLSKGDDYSTNSCRLSNFKLAGAICGLTPQQQCLSLIATKVARLGVLLGSKDSPKNEPIMDSVLDLVNYAVLLSMIMEENDNLK